MIIIQHTVLWWHTVSNMHLASAPDQHYQRFPLWPNIWGSIVLSGLSSSGVPLRQCHQRPLSSPVLLAFKLWFMCDLIGYISLDICILSSGDANLSVVSQWQCAALRAVVCNFCRHLVESWVITKTLEGPLHELSLRWLDSTPNTPLRNWIE